MAPTIVVAHRVDIPAASAAATERRAASTDDVRVGRTAAGFAPP
jgi:hypothetical protein